jgi:hypothetical protein
MALKIILGIVIYIAVCILLRIPFIKAPFMILKGLFTHRALLIILVVAVIGFGAYRTLNKPKAAAVSPSSIPMAYYQEIEPSKTNAPQVIQTVAPDRVYYLSNVIGNPHELQPGETITLAANKYYVYNKEKWELGKLPLPLDRDNYRAIWIYTR